MASDVRSVELFAGRGFRGGKVREMEKVFQFRCRRKRRRQVSKMAFSRSGLPKTEEAKRKESPVNVE
jgi:hypothetical protein